MLTAPALRGAERYGAFNAGRHISLRNCFFLRDCSANASLVLSRALLADGLGQWSQQSVGSTQGI